MARQVNDLRGQRMGYTRGNLAEEKLLRATPGTALVPVDSALDGTNRLLSGDVWALLADDAYVYWTLMRDVSSVEPGFVLPDSLPLVFSIRKDRPSWSAPSTRS